MELAAPTTPAGTIDAAVSGKRTTALAAAYEAEYPRVYGYVRYSVRDRATADDLTSQVFLKAVDRLSSYDPLRSPLRIWLMAIARNVVRDHMRATRRWRWLLLPWFAASRLDEATPEQQLLLGEERQRIIDAVRLLSLRERDVLGLKFAAGLTNRDIAQVTGLSDSHVGVVVYRAVGKLRRILTEEEAHRA
jgi:RNA polymerase sigma factor (sigma-70 family)